MRRLRLGSISLRAQIALLAAGAVAVAVVACSAVAYTATRGQLRSGIDESLLTRSGPPGGPRGGPGPGPRGERPLALEYVVQIVRDDGSVITSPGATVELPVSARDKQVAAGRAEAFFRDVRVEGVHMRMLTTNASVRRNFEFEPIAVQAARSLAEVDSALRGLAIVLFFVSIGGIGIATGLGLLVARSALQPVERLTAAAEHVARTQDLGSAIDVDRTDEIGRLGSSFNAMLRALGESRAQQQRLVHDASHELRTPLTSLRTNIEVLSRISEMDPAEREKLLADLNLEMEELSNLVGELVDLATAPGGTDEDEQNVRLDEIAEQVVERARRRSGQEILVFPTPSVVRARPVQLERALSNVVHNATKWNDPENAIEVRVDGGRFEVRDRGPGIDADDLPHVFDRFYRSPSARSMPGSGLGLAITKQVVEEHRGRVWARNAEDGGAIVGFDLPAVADGSQPESV